MKRTLKKIIDYAVVIAEPEMIILFGSMANEMTISYSSELSLKADVLIYSGSEIERESQKSNSFIAAIIKSGKVVYKNN
ncbi:MAG: hypothetical protein JRE64_02340 [Deltaproteobacteria bacterium]|nr:hypothetical protein [Deltaproteobacteria bacterium]